MLGKTNATSAAYRVGEFDASHFNQYKQLFGFPGARCGAASRSLLGRRLVQYNLHHSGSIIMGANAKTRDTEHGRASFTRINSQIRGRILPVV